MYCEPINVELESTPLTTAPNAFLSKEAGKKKKDQVKDDNIIYFSDESICCLGDSNAPSGVSSPILNNSLALHSLTKRPWTVGSYSASRARHVTSQMSHRFILSTDHGAGQLYMWPTSAAKYREKKQPTGQ